MLLDENLNFDYTISLNGVSAILQHGDAEAFAEAAGLPISYGPGAEGGNAYTLPDPLAAFPYACSPGSGMVGTCESGHPHHNRPAVVIAGTVHVFGKADEYDDDCEYVGGK